MGFFQKTRDMYKMQKQAKGIKKDLRNIHIEAEQEGVKITINGEMEIVEVELTPEVIQEGVASKKNLEEKLLKAFSKGLKKARQIAAEKMKGVMGNFGM